MSTVVYRSHCYVRELDSVFAGYLGFDETQLASAYCKVHPRGTRVHVDVTWQSMMTHAHGLAAAGKIDEAFATC